MIHFVGAGSGAVDLITIRGAKLLKEADCVIYAGSLVNPELLNYCKKDAKIYNSAKLNLDEVLNIMVDEFSIGHSVVRLHTGDPCVYGAIREQMDFLTSNDIEFDYTPGVSSFCGAASALNLEYTLPNVSQSVIITRMAGRTPVPEKESIRNLAKARATMVIFLSSSMVKKLSEELIKGGYPKETPCAMVYKATWNDEKKFITTLENLAEMAKKYNITKTALIIVGDVVNTSDYDKSKLYAPDFTTEFRKGISNEN